MCYCSFIGLSVGCRVICTMVEVQDLAMLGVSALQDGLNKSFDREYLSYLTDHIYISMYLCKCVFSFLPWVQLNDLSTLGWVAVSLALQHAFLCLACTVLPLTNLKCPCTFFLDWVSCTVTHMSTMNELGCHWDYIAGLLSSRRHGKQWAVEQHQDVEATPTWI